MADYIMKRTLLRHYMAEKHLFAFELARRTGVSSSTIYQILGGHRVGSTAVWESIQKELGIPDEEMWAVIHD